MIFRKRKLDKQRLLVELFESLDRRDRPEDVALKVEQLLGKDLASRERSLLESASIHAHQNSWFSWSSMSNDFRRPVGFDKQLKVASELFQGVPLPLAAGYEDPDEILAYLDAAGQQIGKRSGENDFKKDRLNREQRKLSGLDISNRRYNKLFRLVSRLERKRERLLRELKKREITLVSKSRLAHQISKKDFISDQNTAAFIAYYDAKCKRRSEFTITGQTKPYDSIADMLFKRCLDSKTSNWWAIAHIHPVSEVLQRLSDAERGQLIAKWFTVLDEIAGLLYEVWLQSEINTETMIVQRGNDSSTWNTMAGAWNKTREGWINLLYEMNMTEVIDKFCPGKVLRLVAGDLAAWHRSHGDGLDPDTAVWNELPFPWEVLQGRARCYREDVEAVCAKYSVDPVKRAWTAPRPKGQLEAFTPTPELVHGIAIANPGVAKILRRAGVFSGKGVDRDKLYDLVDERMK